MLAYFALKHFLDPMDSGQKSLFFFSEISNVAY